MKRVVFLCVVCIASLISIELFAQVRALGSNSLRFGTGETNDGIFTRRKQYFEEIANARLFFDNFSMGLRYELSNPSEVGPNFNGLRRRWISYSKDGIMLNAGHTDVLYNKGLTVNMFESRPLNYDTWIDGLAGSYQYTMKKEETELRPSFGAALFGGTLDFVDVDTTKPILNIRTYGGKADVALFNKKLVVGLVFAQAFVATPEQSFGNTVITQREVNQPEISLSFITDEFQGYFGFSEMRSHLPQVRNRVDSVSRKGQGMYGSLSYASEDFGITAEYKNYRYFVHAPGTPNERYLSKLPITSPPEVYKEFTYTTITRTTHAVNFDDELGFQIEANITAIPDMSITLNAAASSRHSGYGSTLDSITGLPVAIGSISVFPELKDNAYFPFWEMFGEIEYSLGDLDYVKLFAHRRSDVIAFSGSLADLKRSTTVGVKVQYQTTDNQSLLASVEVQSMFDTQREHNDHKLNNFLLMGQYSFNPLITFGGQFDFSTWYENQARHSWPLGFVSMRIGGSHTLLVSYGAERGGLNCSGGVCRVVPAFEGVRLGLTSQF